MATAIKICRVCGKEYPVCHSLRRGDTTFRWQEVACSPECGEEYLRQILISRGELVEEKHTVEEPEVEPEKVVKKTRRKKAAPAEAEEVAEE